MIMMYYDLNPKCDIKSINGNFRILKWRYCPVPYVWPYFLVIFLENFVRKIGPIYGRYLQFSFLKGPLTEFESEKF